MSNQSGSPQADSEKLLLGKISGVFGVKGWVKVFSETEPRENIVSYSPWYLLINKRWQAFKLLDGKKHGKSVVALLEGVDDRDQAEALKGASIAINPSQLPETSETEFYWRDLKGLQVFNPAGYEFGKVVDILETGANDVLVVRSAELKESNNNAKGRQKYREFLIPYIWQQVILSVDLDTSRLEVDWEPEYLDD